LFVLFMNFSVSLFEWMMYCSISLSHQTKGNK
jgi:hypothetical protein